LNAGWKPRVGSVRWLVLLGLAVSVSSCARVLEPIVTARPTPDEFAIYRMLTEKYTSPAAIVGVHQMSADEAARILRALQSVEPPEGYEALHEQALDAYRQICKGKLLLVGADSMVRAEAYFMVDWGISRLWDYHERMSEVRR